MLRELDPGLPTSPVRTMEEFYQGSAVDSVASAIRMVAWMGPMGLTLALVGLYSLVAYVVARRTREIGIRMAVGAQPGSVLRMVLGHGGWLVLAGVVLGVAGSVAVGGLLRGVLPSRGGIDLVPYSSSCPRSSRSRWWPPTCRRGARRGSIRWSRCGRSSEMLETLWRDIRHGALMLVRNPGFTAVAMLSIAVGVGANAAMFSVADGLVLRPLPVASPGRIVSIMARSAGTGFRNPNLSVSRLH